MRISKKWTTAYGAVLCGALAVWLVFVGYYHFAQERHLKPDVTIGEPVPVATVDSEDAHDPRFAEPAPNAEVLSAACEAGLRAGHDTGGSQSTEVDSSWPDDNVEHGAGCVTDLLAEEEVVARLTVELHPYLYPEYEERLRDRQSPCQLEREAIPGGRGEPETLDGHEICMWNSGQPEGDDRPPMHDATAIHRSTVARVTVYLHDPDANEEWASETLLATTQAVLDELDSS